MLVNHYSTPVTIRPVSTADRNPNVSRLACAPGSCIQSAVVHMHARALTSRETPRDCLRKHASDWYAHLQTLLEILHRVREPIPPLTCTHFYIPLRKKTASPFTIQTYGFMQKFNTRCTFINSDISHLCRSSAHIQHWNLLLACNQRVSR